MKPERFAQCAEDPSGRLVAGPGLHINADTMTVSFTPTFWSDAERDRRIKSLVSMVEYAVDYWAARMDEKTAEAVKK